MNYRHHFHAGNFADVFKHAALAALLNHFKRDPQPFIVIDTHAGAGLYDLAAAEAVKTGEAREGVQRVIAAANPPAALKPYLAALAPDQAGGLMARYPGSPLIALRHLRARDKLVVAELQAGEAEKLRTLLARDTHVRVLPEDGFRALSRLLPPKEIRGAVLIDPPYEVEDEVRKLERALSVGHVRWPGGTFLVWVPIAQRSALAALVDPLRAQGVRDGHVARLLVRGEGAGMLGAALILLNAPKPLLTALEAIGPWLAETLAQGPGAGFTLQTLAKADL